MDQVLALFSAPKWLGQRQATEHPLKNWEWTIYQMPPFLWQEVAPSTVVFFFFFQLFLGSWFGNSKGL